MDTSKTADVRVNDTILAPLERPALQWLCKQMPVWMTPDIPHCDWLHWRASHGGCVLVVQYE
jgi:hypothetical protein